MTQTTHLILVPTRMEADLLVESLTRLAQPLGESWESLLAADLELVGFGPVTAAARTAMLLERRRVQRVTLVGIAGLFENGTRLGFQVGDAATFASVHCYGIGAGFGASHQSASDLGWSFWDTEGESIRSTLDLIPFSHDGLQKVQRDEAGAETNDLAGEPLQLSGSVRPVDRGLITVTCAAGSASEAAERARLFPNAIGEDMEAFGVATACKFAGVGLSVVRGFSNLVGDRQHERWQIKPAIQSVAEKLIGS